jgi:hypothetical protein
MDARPGPRARTATPLRPRRDLAARFATAFTGDDVEGIVALLTDDAWFTMPPVRAPSHASGLGVD